MPIRSFYATKYTHALVFDDVFKNFKTRFFRKKASKAILSLYATVILRKPRKVLYVNLS